MMPTKLLTALPVMMLVACGAAGDGTVAGVNDLTADDPHAEIQDIAMGDDRVCALLKDATVRCWGGNGFWSSPDQAIPGLRDVASLAASGDETCAVIRDGSVHCWGGTGAYGTSPSRSVPGVANVAEIAMADGRTCARLTSGEVRCWSGAGPSYADSFVNGWFGAVSITTMTVEDTGQNWAQPHSWDARPATNTVCMTVSEGTVVCQSRRNAYTPSGPQWRTDADVLLPDLRGASRIALSRHRDFDKGSDGKVRLTDGRSTCGLVANELVCIAEESVTPLVDNRPGPTDEKPRKIVRMPAPDGRVAMRGELVCFLANGQASCTGRNGADFLPAKEVPGVTNAVAIVMGGYATSNTCALRRDGGIVCWNTQADGTAKDVGAPLYLPPPAG